MNRLSPVVASIVLFVAALLGTTLPLPARAAESYDNCTGFIDTVPTIISSPGTWCLRHDVSTAISSGFAILVAANNVTIDCNDFKVGGLAAGTGTGTYGIYIYGRLNTTVHHCNVRGFYHGILALSGGGYLIEHNSLDSNTGSGVYVDGPGSTIRSNRVIDTGGSTSSTGLAYGIYTGNGVDILDNTINGVAAAPLNGNASSFGIVTSFNQDGSVVGNRIGGLTASGNGITHGIYNANSGRTITRENDVRGSGVAGSIGVFCEDNKATSRANVIIGFATGIQNCLSSGDTVNTN